MAREWSGCGAAMLGRTCLFDGLHEAPVKCPDERPRHPGNDLQEIEE